MSATLAFAEAFCISRRLVSEWFNDLAGPHALLESDATHRLQLLGVRYFACKYADKSPDEITWFVGKFISSKNCIGTNSLVISNGRKEILAAPMPVIF